MQKCATRCRAVGKVYFVYISNLDAPIIVLAQDQFCNTRGLQVGHGGGVVVKKGPLSDRIPILPSSAHGLYSITALMWC